MKDDKLKIHLRIDNELYPLVIDRDKEELYRKAAKQIDYKLTNIAVCIRSSAWPNTGL